MKIVHNQDERRLDGVKVTGEWLGFNLFMALVGIKLRKR